MLETEDNEAYLYGLFILVFNNGKDQRRLNRNGYSKRKIPTGKDEKKNLSSVCSNFWSRLIFSQEVPVCEIASPAAKLF